jgi:hypothetical protein
MLQPMGLGKGHGAQHSKLARREANSGELGALGMRLIVTPGFGRQIKYEPCVCEDQNSRTQRLHK